MGCGCSFWNHEGHLLITQRLFSCPKLTYNFDRNSQCDGGKEHAEPYQPAPMQELWRNVNLEASKQLATDDTKDVAGEGDEGKPAQAEEGGDR